MLALCNYEFGELEPPALDNWFSSATKQTKPLLFTCTPPLLSSYYYYYLLSFSASIVARDPKFGQWVSGGQDWSVVATEDDDDDGRRRKTTFCKFKKIKKSKSQKIRMSECKSQPVVTKSKK